MTYVHNSRLRKMEGQPPKPVRERKGTTSSRERKDALKAKVSLSQLTYANKATWDTPVIYGDNQPKVPPVRTTEEYHRDRELGLFTPVGKDWKPLIEKGK
jgi:hypothetical protein